MTLALPLLVATLVTPVGAQSFLPAGEFEDDYGIRYSISPEEWVQQDYGRYVVRRWDASEQFLIAQNHADNATDAGLWTRIDWMLLDDMAPYEWAFCLTEYKAESPEAAAAASPAVRPTPRTGCNGYPFSRMRTWQPDLAPKDDKPVGGNLKSR